jgi:monofunctional biosynthetic peptidoglycan transglycosylase
MARKRRTGGRLIRLIGQGLAVILAIAFACAAYIYLTLPDVRGLRTENPQTTAFMELRDREARAAGEQPRRQQRWIPYARISPNLTRAVLVTEDSAFWDHDGVDYEQVKESIGLNLDRMEFVRGGSTITQQLAKNLYLSPSKNPVRKLRELIIARRLEAELSKRRILELYLNVIEWGDQVYGAEAAARRYFRKSASTVTAEESALLAGAIRNPRLLDPATPTARLRRLQHLILSRMGAITPPTATDPADVPVALPVALPPAEGAPAVLPGEVIPTRPPGGEGAGSGTSRSR